MNRRKFLIAVVSSLALLPLTATAKEELRVVGHKVKTHQLQYCKSGKEDYVLYYADELYVNLSDGNTCICWIDYHGVMNARHFDCDWLEELKVYTDRFDVAEKFALSYFGIKQ